MQVAKYLKENTNLQKLDLKGNNFTKVGWAALRKAEFDDTSLNAAADSNHTCAIEYPSEIEGLDISEMNYNPNTQYTLDFRYVREKKIYSVLSSRNRDCSNVKHFEDVPVELLPNMLHSIQKYSTYQDGDTDISQIRGHVNPLSIVYEICRNWEDSLATFETLSLSKTSTKRCVLS